MQGNWGMPGRHDIASQSKLVTAGPYAFGRNPIYVGLIAMTIGFGLALKSYGILLMPFIIAHFRRMIFKEEILLEKYFGKTYAKYKSEVPRFL